MQDKRTNKLKQAEKTAKTHAKALGVQSVLVADNKTIITSYARIRQNGGKKIPVIEKVLDCNNQDIKRTDTSRMLCARPLEQGNVFVLPKKENKRLQDDPQKHDSVLNNPLNHPDAEDYVGIKSIVEKIFFGKSFPHDTLHVQIAYNLLDVKKILSAYISNICYTFFNLHRSSEDTSYSYQNDMIGTLCSYKTLAEQEAYIKNNPNNTTVSARKLLRDTQAYYTYYDNVFRKPKDKSDNAALEYNYNVLRLLSFCRQLCMHSDNKNMPEYGIFHLSSALKNNPELLSLLDDVYQKGLDQIHKDFLNNAQNNLSILNRIYQDCPTFGSDKQKRIDALTEQYYSLTVKKDDANIGFNLTRLREAIVKQFLPEALDCRHDTYRGKMYTLMNFVLYTEITRNNDRHNELVDALRANSNGEQGKERIYCEYARTLTEKLNLDRMLRITYQNVCQEAERHFSGEIESSIRSIQEQRYAIKASNTYYFVKLIYFLGKFLDGKESNELDCALINKFDNIADILAVSDSLYIKVLFRDEFRELSSPSRMSEQLRIAKRLAHMKPEVSSLSEQVWLDALTLLGEPVPKRKFTPETEHLEYDKRVLTPEYAAFYQEYLAPSENKGNKTKRSAHPLRNFVANNVLKSKWFFYIAKYLRPEKCRKLMTNSAILQFALNDLPETQIDRYYAGITGIQNSPLRASEKYTQIIRALQNFSFAKVSDNIRKQGKQQSDQVIVQLYLTVAYLITKSLIKVNIRFFIAQAMLDRDMAYKKTLIQDAIDMRKQKSVSNSLSTKEKQWANLQLLPEMQLTLAYLDRDHQLHEQFYQEVKQMKTRNLPAKQAKEEYKRIYRSIIPQKHYDRHTLDYLTRNACALGELCDSSKLNILKIARNKIVHLNVIEQMDRYLPYARNVRSYYGLYCFLLQKVVLQEFLAANTNNDAAKRYLEEIDKHGTFCKDLMWLLNLPYAYCLPRYKNLSVENLYYNIYGETDSKDSDIE